MFNVFAGARRLAVIAAAAVMAGGIYESEFNAPRVRRSVVSPTAGQDCAQSWTWTQRELHTPSGTPFFAAVYWCGDGLDRILAESKLSTLADTVSRSAIDHEASALHRAHRLRAGLRYGTALAVLLVAVWPIGWIARGLMGIPNGMDLSSSRVPPPSPEP